ncbi:MAG: ABC transporter permease subunit [Planctomycetota bacterium]
MFKLTWKSWLAVLVGILLVFGGLFAMITAQGQPTIAYWLGFAGGVLAAGWSLFGLVHWRDVPLVKRFNTLVIATLGFGVVTLLFLAVEWEPGYTTSIYCYLAVLGFLVGINLLRLLLRPGHPVLGVARTMVEESLRMGVALIFIIAMLVLLPMLPLIFGAEDRVTYMVQRFLTYSNMIVAVLLGLMTVLLAARTVSLEIATRQIHMTLTKPLGRAQYLLGKWLGIVLLNAVLLVVAGIATYGFTMGIAQNPALNDLDRYEVDREVLTARLAQTPGPVDSTWEQMYSNVLLEKQLSDPNRFGAEGTAFSLLADDAKQEVMSDTVSRFYTVNGGQSQDFVITGLGAAAAAAERAALEAQDMLVEEAGFKREQAEVYVEMMQGKSGELDNEVLAKVTPDLFDRVQRTVQREIIQLSLTPSASPKPDNQNTEVFLKINGVPWPPPPAPTAPAPQTRLVVEIANELPVPAGLINKQGEMVITVEVPDKRTDGFEQESVRFNYKDAVIEVFYRVGTFESNLVKALVIVWLKLAFLAMVGLMAGSLLTFPVAAMLSLIVFVAAAASGTISESLDSYAGLARSDNTWEVITGTFAKFFGHIGSGEVYDAFKLLLRLIGEAFMLLIPSFGEFNTHRPLSEGHVISNGTVATAGWKIGLLWNGIAAVIGLYLFNKKEIARVQV